jgi:hypothetical protein
MTLLITPYVKLPFILITFSKEGRKRQTAALYDNLDFPGVVCF